MNSYKVSDNEINLLLKQIEVPRRAAIDLLTKHKGNIMECILDNYDYIENDKEDKETDVHKINIKKLRNIADEKDSILEKKIKTKEIKIKKGKLKSNKYKITFTTFTNNDNNDRLTSCLNSHEKYCKKHGYKYELCNNVDKNILYNSQKISQVKNILDNGNDKTVCVWINGSTLITNNNIKIIDFISLMEDKDILVSRDIDNINLDIMIIKNTEWSKYFISNLEKIDSNTNVNNFITNLYEKNVQLKKKIQVISSESQFIINSYPETFRKESFLVNFLNMSGINLDNAIKQFENHANDDIKFNFENINVEC